ncbi:hypothetical protein R1sor_021991 [Riccia sorocarpa]|uniref:MULE transposase domain-containing protein n=1 Tax=Riccia sorocarpa TaxID=122646 RepID=A0ABD3GIK2_9MARC
MRRKSRHATTMRKKSRRGRVRSLSRAIILNDIQTRLKAVINRLIKAFPANMVASELNTMKISDDAVATLNWTKFNSEKILMYQIPSKKARRPFLLAWQTDWMLGKLATLGHGSNVSMDATFGINKHGEMKEKVNTYLTQTLQTVGEWRPSCFLTDDAEEENVALNEVFPGVPVNLCLWHVRRAWIKKLHSLVKDPFAKALMNGELGSIMYRVNEGYSEVELLHMLGIKWGTDAGGLQNVQPCDALDNVEIANLGLAA